MYLHITLLPNNVLVRFSLCVCFARLNAYNRIIFSAAINSIICQRLDASRLATNKLIVVL